MARRWMSKSEVIFAWVLTSIGMAATLIGRSQSQSKAVMPHRNPKYAAIAALFAQRRHFTRFWDQPRLASSQIPRDKPVRTIPPRQLLGLLDQRLQSRLVARDGVGVDYVASARPIQVLGDQPEFLLGLFDITSCHGLSHRTNLFADHRLDGAVSGSVGDVLTKSFFGAGGVGHLNLRLLVNEMVAGG